ncbi:hypothetical protein D2L64_23385 [Micromonospora radicis]|uniref:Uncharacterized protein n=1 Tax=Micromonospora radicis TaxID=1894971 RepID=A0A418MP82_9ACTN|nr:hypothetical protein D2L64_23385 [Micromonospora radicis]
MYAVMLPLALTSIRVAPTAISVEMTRVATFRPRMVLRPSFSTSLPAVSVSRADRTAIPSQAVAPIGVTTV